jgi:hypothetical protein
MAPTLSDGDYVVALSDDVCAQPPGIGSVVIVNHAELGVLVKRILAVDDLGRFAIGGDNPMSLPRDSLGHIEAHQVVGRVFLSIPRKGFPRWVGTQGDLKQTFRFR